MGDLKLPLRGMAGVIADCVNSRIVGLPIYLGGNMWLINGWGFVGILSVFGVGLFTLVVQCIAHLHNFEVKFVI